MNRRLSRLLSALNPTDLLPPLFPARLRQWLGPLFVAGTVAAVLAITVITTGFVDLAASTPHPPGWADLLHFVFKRSTAHNSADTAIPADLATTPVAKGAMLFDAVCANCHGRPGYGQNAIALSMRPRPQYLGAVVGGMADRDLFWVVKHGVKYSAMPAWPTQARDDEVWTIVAFLRQLPKLDAASYARLIAPAAMIAQPLIAGPIAGRAGAMPVTPLDQTSIARPAIGFGGQSLAANGMALCTGCHGNDAVPPRSGGIPALGLLNPETISAALLAYHNGTRKSGFMGPTAIQLTPIQINGLAKQLGGSSHPQLPAPPASPAQLALGQNIAERGGAHQQVTPCQNCHDINKATARAYPAIAGQDWRYLRDQLRLYRDGIRVVPLGGNQTMTAESARLTSAEIDAVTAWYAAQPSTRPAPVPEGGK